jgi:cell division protein FtsI/penicillin-binding protein 2
VLDAACEERVLVEDPVRVAPILAGMRRAVTEGTARRLRAPAGVRLYAKTGTASDPGRIDEVPYGYQRGKPYREHSWMVAIAEPASRAACDVQAAGRLAFAAVVPRGGAGAGPALTIVQRLIDQTVALGLLTDPQAEEEKR